MTCTNPQGLCDPLSQPTLKEPCEDHSKCYEWKTGDWSKVADEFWCCFVTPDCDDYFQLVSSSTRFFPTGPTDASSRVLQCSSSCGKGLQSRVVQCMHKVTGRHGNECPVTSRPPTYRPCHQGTCNEKINVNTITSPRLGETPVRPAVPPACTRRGRHPNIV